MDTPDQQLPVAPAAAWAALAWLSVASLGYALVLQPLLGWLALAMGWPGPPELDYTLALPLAAAILGVPTIQALRRP
jgi:hypothetical protein